MKKNYIVICTDKGKNFDDEVNEKIDEGYMPCGGIVIDHIEAKTFFVQPMILAEIVRASFPRSFPVPSSQKLVDAISNAKIEVRKDPDAMRFYRETLPSYDQNKSPLSS